MSAVFGLINLDGRPVSPAHLELMEKALTPHGPDRAARWINGHVGLGHRLMCINPEDGSEPQQPLVHDGGRLVLTSDARIDNLPELTETLGTASGANGNLRDLSVILRAYEKWGADCASHLVGAFVFALWDLREQTVLLARSQMGERSLFYHETPGSFAFSSAPRGLFALPFVPREIDTRCLADFLVYAPKERGSSYFSQIRRLEPAHSILVKRAGFRSWQYRSLNLSCRFRHRSDTEIVENFNILFDRVIADHLPGSTSAGVSMSGGLDSTAIAASAASTLRRRNERLHVFTEIPGEGLKAAAPEGWYADETPYVKAMARHHENIDVHFVRSGAGFYLDQLDRLFDGTESPVRGSSNLPWITEIFEEAGRRNIRTLLTGMPGNLTVSWTGEGLLPDLLRGWKWKRAIDEASAIARCEGNSSTVRVLAGRGLAPLLPIGASRAIRQLRSGGRVRLRAPFWETYSPIRREFAQSQKVEERAREKGHFRSAISPERRALHLLRQADARADTTRGYEALCGVQKRDPLADARLVEFCLSLPEDQYLREGQARWLIRRAMAGRVPDEILSNCRRGFQASGWLGTLTAARTRIAAELDTMQKSALANSAIDIGRMRLLLEKLEYARPDRPGSLSEYRGVLELGLTVGRFVLWAESGA